MDIIHYFEPFKGCIEAISGFYLEDAFESQISFFDGEAEWFADFKGEVVIIGVPESRNSPDNKGCSNAADNIRKYLYALSAFDEKLVIGDAGNLKGNSINDKYQALQEVITFFNSRGVVVLLLGGSQDLTLPVLKGMLDIDSRDSVNIAVGDAMLDIDSREEDFSSLSWLSFLINGLNLNLGDLTVFGTQKYLISNMQERFLKNNFFDILRLGELRGENISRVEVPLRDADLVSIDFRMIKGQPQFKSSIASPHGIDAHDACRVMRYCGMSDKVMTVGIFEVPNENIGYYNNYLLAAEMCWHFIDGFLGRQNDAPDDYSGKYKKYIVPLEGLDKPLVYYQNIVNERWWFNDPLGDLNEVIACNREDYRLSLRNEIPSKWWRLFMRKTYLEKQKGN